MVDFEERSPLWGLGSTSALLGGAGYALYKSKSQLASVLASNPGSINESIIAAVAKSSNFNTRRTYSSISDEVTQGFVAKLQSNSTRATAKADIFHSAYEAMVSTGNITSSDALAKLAGITDQPTALGAYSIATQAIAEAGGDPALFSRRIQDLATGDRLQRLGGMAYSKGGYGTSISSPIMYNQLSESFRAREKIIKENIVSSASGRFEVGFGTKYTGTLDNPLMSVMVGEQEFNIPLNTKAENIRLGTANYSLRGAFGPGGNQLSYSELMENTIKDMLAKSNNQTQLRGEIHKANQMLIDSMRTRDSAALAAAIWTPPEGALTSGGRAINRLRNLEIVPYDVTEEGIESLIGTKVFPYTSPQSAAKGVMSSKHLAQYLYGDLGLLIGPEYRPGQPLRAEWGSTKAAKQAALSKGFRGEFGKYYNRLERKGATAGYKQLYYGGLSAAAEEAYSVPQLLTYYAQPGDMGFANDKLNRILAAEEIAINPSAAGMMQHERSFVKHISLNKNLETNQQILSALQNQSQGEFIPLDINPSPIENMGVGVEVGTGRRLELKQTDALSQRIVGMQLTGPDEAIIHFKETRNLSAGEYLKTFSEEQKSIAGVKSKVEFQKALQAAGIQGEIAGQEIEAIGLGKIVQRNKAALITQQMEAMSVFAAKKLQPGMDPIAESAIRAFLEDPAKASMVSEIMARENKNAHIAIQQNLIGLAKNFGFTSKELGFTFGLTSEDVLKPLVSSGALRAKEAYGILHSGVIGLGKGFVGDLVSANWGRGSFEQTGFRLLSMKGQEGIDYAAELSKRIINKGELGALSQMEATILGEEGIFKKLMRSTPESILEGDLIREEGRYVSLGRRFDTFGQSNTLYIPGTKEAPYSINRLSIGDQEIKKPLESELLYLRKTIERANNNKATQEELELAAKGVRDAVIRATEEQATARGKILGSRIVTNVRGSGTSYGMSEIDINRMFRDLTESATSTAQLEELTRQRQVLEEGGTVASALWRHPTTGPESAQFVNIKMDKALKEGTISVPYQEGRMTIKGSKGTKAIDMSAMTGLKADFDRDQLVISAIADRDLQARISKKVDHEIRDQYTTYLFNHYGMKDFFEKQVSKTDVLKMNSADALLAGYKKLTTAKSTTGQINIALQQFKLGLAYSAPEKYRPMAELFYHLEEAAIGGKHGLLGENLYQSIAAAAKGGEAGVKSMEQVLSTIFGGNEVSLTGEITTEAGETMKRSLSFNTNELARQAVESGSAVRDEVKVAMDAVRLSKGKNIGELGIGAHVERMFLRKRGGVDVAGILMQANAENMNAPISKASRIVSSLEGKATSVLNALKRNKKSMLIGGGIAAGLMFMAPATSGVIKPTTSGGGEFLGEEDISPAYGLSMNPPPPRQNRSPRIYDIGSGRPTTHANIRMRMDDLNSSSRDFMSSAREMSQGGNVNIEARDNRLVTDPYLLASKIHERL